MAPQERRASFTPAALAAAAPKAAHDPGFGLLLRPLLYAAANAARQLTGSDRAVAAVPIRTAESRAGLLMEYDGGDTALPSGVVRSAIRSVREGGVLSVSDLARERSAAWRAAARLGVRGLAVVRLPMGAARGSLLVSSATWRRYSPADIASLQGVAQCTSHALDGAQAMVRAERRRVARSVHDTLGHTLATLLVAIERLEESLVGRQQRLLARTASWYGWRAARKVHEQIEAAELGTREENQVNQIPDLVKQASQAGLAVTFTTDLDVRSIPSGIGTCLYQVAREALVNVA